MSILTETAAGGMDAVIVERSKKCWDYCTTIFFFHCLISAIWHVIEAYLFNV